MAINTNYTSSLAYSLFTNSKQGTTTSLASTLASINKEKTSFLTKDAKGKYTLPSLDSIAKATTPADKLKAVSRMASATKIYTDAATKTGITTRLSEMTKQVETVMNGLESAVTSLKQNGTLKASQSEVNTTLTTLKTCMSQIGKLMNKLPATKAKSVKESLVALDTQAKKIAQTANLKYTSLFTSKGSVSASTTTATSNTNRLVDYLA